MLFDRSWYNRAGVERVMGFCTDEEYREFLRSCPEFERMLARSGIILIKYWFSVSDEEQENRFKSRLEDPTRRWKLSPMDLESRRRWMQYSVAKDEMFKYTDTKQAPWYVVNSDDKKRARLNCISHLLSMIPYEDLTPSTDRTAATARMISATSAHPSPIKPSSPRSIDSVSATKRFFGKFCGGRLNVELIAGVTRKKSTTCTPIPQSFQMNQKKVCVGPGPTHTFLSHFL